MPERSLLNISELGDTDEPDLIDQKFPLQEFLNWFSQAKRDLPWRHNPSFYEVLVSEFMLQQTVVATVLPYYSRWMMQFPSLLHLAQASSDEVLKAWEGLGYYSRARRLHEVAKYIINESKSIPTTYESLMSLKGIGDYTAKALLAFAFKKPEIAIDGNVLRVGARFLGIKESIAKTSTKKLIQTFFDQCPKEDGSMAEGLIELGALICRKKPECTKCPLTTSCRAYLNHWQDLIPVVPQRKKTQKIQNEIAICIHKNELLITKHNKNLMKDLCEFPKLQLLDSYGLTKEDGKSLGKVKASYTVFEETMLPFIFELNDRIDLPGFFWVSFENLERFSFSSGHKKIKNMVMQEIESS